jgi:hypothetical protein
LGVERGGDVVDGEVVEGDVEASAMRMVDTGGLHIRFVCERDSSTGPAGLRVGDRSL